MNKSRLLFRFLKKTCRYQHTSALYIPGSKGVDKTFVVRPDLDFTKTFRDISQLRRNVKLRGMRINVDELRRRYNEIEAITTELDELQLRKDEIRELFKVLSVAKREDELSALAEQGKLLKARYKELNAKWHDYEENVILQLLKLPNSIHEDTPEDSELVIKTCGDKPSSVIHGHTEMYKQRGLLKFSDISPTGYYFENDLATVEQDMLNYFSNIMQKAYFIPISNPDFVRSVVIEGCGKSVDNPDSAFCLAAHQDMGALESCNAEYLVGGNSLESFCSYFARTTVENTSEMPLCFFSCGKSYNKPSLNLKESLFSVWQETTVDAFVGCEDEHELDYYADEMVDIISAACDDLGFPFRVIRVPIKQLSTAESLKAVLQMYSPALQEWVDIAWVSLYGDWISRRLMMHYYLDEGRTIKGYLHILHARVISVTRLLGILGEIPELKPKI